MPRSGYKYTYVPGRYLPYVVWMHMKYLNREKSVLHFICLRIVQSGTLILGIYIPTMRKHHRSSTPKRVTNLLRILS